MTREQTEIIIRNDHGLHARPAAQFVQTAARFKSAVTLRNLTRGGERAINAKSIMEVLTAGVDRDHRIELTAEGDDAGEAVQTLQDLIEHGME